MPQTFALGEEFISSNLVVGNLRSSEFLDKEDDTTEDRIDSTNKYFYQTRNSLAINNGLYRYLCGIFNLDTQEKSKSYFDTFLIGSVILNIPKATHQVCEYRNRTDIELFLSEHNDLKFKLPIATSKVQAMFPGIKLALELVKDPDAITKREDLFLYVVTKLGPNQAMPLLDKIDNILFKDGLMADSNFNTNIEYI